jgi:hypothetical protein
MMKLEGFGGKRSWPNFKILSRHSPGGTEENTKNIIQDSRSPDRDLNPGPLENEVGGLTTQPRRSLSCHAKKIYMTYNGKSLGNDQ